MFGILKRRFLILKYPIQLHDIGLIDEVVSACSILHNMLIDFDGVDTDWDDALINVHNDGSDLDSGDDNLMTSDSIQRAQNNRVSRRMKLREVERSDVLERGSSVFPDSLGDTLVGPRFNELILVPEKEDDHFTLRSKLIHSFNIQKALKKVFWIKP